VVARSGSVGGAVAGGRGYKRTNAKLGAQLRSSYVYVLCEESVRCATQLLWHDARSTRRTLGRVYTTPSEAPAAAASAQLASNGREGGNTI